MHWHSRLSAILVFLLAASSVHFLTVRARLILDVADIFLRYGGYSILLASTFVIASSVAGISVTRWALEPKFLVRRSLPYYAAHWGVTFLVLVWTSYLKIALEEGYVPGGNTHETGWDEAARIWFACVVIVSGYLGVFSAFYKWVAPSLGRIDYSGVRALLFSTIAAIDGDKVAAQEAEPADSDESCCRETLNLLQKTRIQVEGNLAFEDHPSEKSAAWLLRGYLLNLEHFFQEIIDQRRLSDLQLLRTEALGGYVDKPLLAAKKAVLQFCRYGDLG